MNTFLKDFAGSLAILVVGSIVLSAIGLVIVNIVL